MRTVLITGGARGIGAACVRRFAARGDRAWFLYEKNDAAAEAVSHETGATAIRCDVADAAQVRRVFETLPPLDVLVCNAGIVQYGLLSTITDAEWRRLFAVNVDGVFHCVRAALPGMLQKKDGCIVTVSSMWGQVGASCEAGYSATKGAVIALSKALAQELGPSNVRVNSIAPGVIDTDMCANLSSDTRAMLRDETPLERMGQPDDVAKAAEYLADADFITGQVLPVTGGFVIT